MRTYRLAAVLLIAAVACGGGSSKSSAWRPPTKNVRAAPAVDGHAVWIDDATNTVWTEDCALAHRLVAAGGPYGPTTKKDAAGNLTVTAYASACRS